MAFIPYISNRLEPLADKLCEVLMDSSSDDNIFKKEYIIVQAKGMEQWLKYRIADNNGIASLLEFPFPQIFLDNFFPGQNNDLSESLNSSTQVKFSRKVLTWSIMKELPCLISADNESGANLFVSLRAYLNSELKSYSAKYDIKLLQLSEKIADLFYKYLAYRPDCLLYWEGEKELSFNIPNHFKEESWQKVLWNKVSESLGFDYLPRRVYDSIKSSVISRDTQLNQIQRAFVFGITSMPPFYLEVFIELSKHIDIHFFYRNICCDNWEHNYSEKELFKYFSRMGCEINMPDTGNELLASLASREREFFSLLVSGGFVDSEGDYIEYSNSQKGKTLLSSIQNDILNMNQPAFPQTADEYDDTIQFHSFHSPMREIEFLHDFLLKSMDESGGDIKPKDIIVMTPDIQKYAPFIEAVFESEKHEDSFIYSTISDRNIKDTNVEAEAFLKLLKLANSRFKVTDVLSLLSVKAVSKSFGFDEHDMDLIHKWLKECAVNWGIDEQNRKDVMHSETAFYENSWKFGLDRMILGYSMTSAERDITQSIYTLSNRFCEKSSTNSDSILTYGHAKAKFRSCGTKIELSKTKIPPIFQILPYEEIEGSNSIVLGKLMDFTEELFALNSSVSSEASPSEWRNILSEIIDVFFAGGDDVGDSVDILYRSVNSMFNDINSSGFSGKIGIDIVCSYLSKNLMEKLTPLQFLRGGVSFCRFTPMRSIPAKIICMIGMNDDAFPNKESKTGFDLMSYQRRSCDPSLKIEDRYMFLESLISASDILYISYIGRSVTDNSRKLPSVIVSELKEYIDRNYCSTENDSSVSTALSIEHPLHGFSSVYFTSESDSAKKLNLFSYSKENFIISKFLNYNETEKNPYLLSFDEDIPEIKDKTVTVEDLVVFYQNPSKYLLNRRLDINLDIYKKEELNDKEIIDFNNLQQYFVNQDILSIIDTDCELTEKETLNVLKARGLIPPGKWGESCTSEIVQDVIKFKEGLAEFIVNKEQTVYSENLSCNIPEYGKTELSLEFSNLYKKGQIFFRFGSARVIDLINAWVFHVALCLTKYTKNRTTYLITWDKKKADHIISFFDSIEITRAKDIMETFLQYFYSGNKNPLPFFPESSMAYVEKLKKNGKQQDAYSSALKKWEPSDYSFAKSDSENYYFKACFGENFPCVEDIDEPALDFFLPLLEMKESQKMDRVKYK